MKPWLLPVLVLVAATGCGPAMSDCVCNVSTLMGPRDVTCGTAMCLGADSYACSPRGVLTLSSGSCASTMPQPNGCTLRVCNGACGAVPDGCGGTLQCGGCGAGQRCGGANVCESVCAGISCSAGQRCEPTTGTCVASACTAAGAVCGVVDGQTCGTCPGTSVCASTKKQCVDTVTSIPIQYVMSTALVGDRLFVSGLSSLQANGRDLFVVDLSTRQTQQLATATVLSPLATNGASVYWTDTTGVRRIVPGSTTPTTITGLSGYCADLIVANQELFCGYGGSARYGVDAFGIKRLPLGGGTFTWAKRFLNSPRMAFAAPYLFYVGTTDNYSSFGNLGAYDTSDNTDQVLASGGILDSRFIMADDDAFYFARNQTGATIERMPYTATQSTDLITSESGISRDTTVLQGGSLFTVAKVAGVEGLWQVPVAAPATRSVVLTAADLKLTSQNTVSNLHMQGAGWLFVTGSTVYRTVAPAQ